MTYRERREARAERLRGWADKRQTDATALLARDEHYRGDIAFNTQPGHIPERARVIARTDRAFASLAKAERMTDRAKGIEDQLDHAIYSDDPDAIERLRERIAYMEAERDRIKAYNASCRKGAPNLSLLDAGQQAGLLTIARVAAYSLGKHGEMPGYALTNLSGNISRNRERLARLEGTYTAPGSVPCATCGHVKIIHGPKARPGCDECGNCAGFIAA